MAQQARIPKFGNWDAGENAPYTQYFNDARKLRTEGKLINPNDPEEYQSSVSDDPHLTEAPPLRTSSDPDQQKIQYQQHASGEGQDFHGPSYSPARHEFIARKSSQDSTLPYEDKPSSGDPQRRHIKSSTGSEHSVDNSQAKSTRSSTEGGHGAASSTPPRFRMKTPDRNDDIPEKGTAVPKFGAWDESDPSSADGFTDIFNKVRDEKKATAKAPMIMTEPDYETMYKGQVRKSQPSGCSCLQWFKK